MIARMLVAVLGALIVTAGLLLTMDAVTSAFRDRNLQRYFRITDILPRPDPGRPERPPPVGRQPGVPGGNAERPDVRIEFEAPRVVPLAPAPGIIGEQSPEGAEGHPAAPD